MKNHITKLLLCLLGVLPLMPQHLYAQRALLRPLEQMPQGAVSQQGVPRQAILQNLQKKAKGGKTTVLGFDKTVLQDNSILLQLPTGETIEAVMDEKDVRGKDDFSWHGHIKGRPGSVVLVFLEDQMSGNVVVGDKSYSLTPLGKGACVLFENESAKYPEDHPKDYREDASQTTTMDSGTLATADHCGVVRLLVAYTPAAETGALGKGFSNIKLFIQQAISETNQSYLNSGISHRVSLAIGIRVSYTESGSFETDLSRFRGTSDGYMDNVHTYRNLYTADVGVLLVSDPSYCGLASGIGSTAATAFCAVNYDCALGNYSFGHEIGHLHGARHNPESDNTLTPYAYGHGYCYAAGNWRTIMSYNSCGGSHTRIQYWSNPRVTYGGVAMGTAARHDNARVHNETAATLAGFRVSPATLVLGASSNLTNNNIGFATATSEVVLSPGFVVSGNSELRVAVMTPSCDPPVASADASSGTAPAADAASPALQVSPVPTTGMLDITVSFPQKESADIGIYDLLGTRVRQVHQGAVDRKRFTVDLSQEQKGIYIVVCRTTNGVIRKRVILN